MTNYRQGVASIYVVVFTTLLLAVTGGSFIRIVLRDTIGSIKLDSSQAALDAAYIGLEEGKIALTKYHRCLTEGLTGTIETGDGTVDCSRIVAVMQESTASTDCNIVQKILGQSYVSGSEIPITTNRDSVDPDDIKGENLDQAISCILISNEEDDYRGALANSTPPQSKLVPLRTTSIAPGKYVKIQWFSREDGNNTTYGRNHNMDNKSTDPAQHTGMLLNVNYNEDKRVSPLYVQLLQANRDFNLSEFYLNNGANTNSAAVLFIPTTADVGSTYLSAAQYAASNNKTSTNQPVPVRCSTLSGNFLCSAIIELPTPINAANSGVCSVAALCPRNAGANFLRLMIPYGNPYTQYAVTLCAAVRPDKADCTDTIPFTVQSSISSTGRAGDDFRRIETRVEFVDSQFPLPQYALNIDSSIEKNFYVTENNWGGVNYGEAVNMSTAD